MIEKLQTVLELLNDIKFETLKRNPDKSEIYDNCEEAADTISGIILYESLKDRCRTRRWNYKLRTGDDNDE